MATHRSALKRARQNIRRRARNRANRSRLRNQVKRLQRAMERGEEDVGRNLLPSTVSLIDASRKKGILHPNAAARAKSRLTRRLNRTAPDRA